MFLTGYGLTIKYGFERNNISTLHYIGNHFCKLEILLISGLVFYYIVFFLFNYNLKSISHLFAQILFVANWLPYPNLAIEPGPYWYLGLTMHLYLLYRYVIIRMSSYSFVIMIIFSLLLLFIFRYDFVVLRWLRYNFVGNILAFSVGILFAQHPYSLRKCDGYLLLLTTFIGLVLSNWSFYLWILSPIVAILFYYSLVCVLPDFFNKLLSKIGIYSSSIFIVHPTIRLFLFSSYENSILSSFLWIFIYVILVSLCAFFHYFIIFKINMLLKTK